MSTQRNSKQRDAVYADLMSRYDHPTADEVYFSVKKDLPNISLATVYRNLKLLENEGLILKITTEDSDRYDGHTQTHYHLMCDRCKKVSDLNIKNGFNLNELPDNEFNGEIRTHALLFFGLCKDCKQTKN
ncbi:MAG: transcriptional repressor [Clostridia bacterium]|nr:transcriptional repressor [Clostridia bacterium]